VILVVCPFARICREWLLGDRWLIRTKTVETVFNKAARQFRHWNALPFGLLIEGIDQITTKPRRVVSLHNRIEVPDGGIAISVLHIYYSKKKQLLVAGSNQSLPICDSAFEAKLARALPADPC
jgi:hypothetical protein